MIKNNVKIQKCTKKERIKNTYEGEQNISPQSMPLWYTDYFELKLLEKQMVQERPSDPSLSP